MVHDQQLEAAHASGLEALSKQAHQHAEETAKVGGSRYMDQQGHQIESR